MPLNLPVPTNALSSQEIPLGGVNYTFNYSFNTRDNRWRIDIYQGSTQVISGVKVMENQGLLSRYRLKLFNHGEIFAERVKDDGLPVGRHNFGPGLAYELTYYTNSELTSIASL